MITAIIIAGGVDKRMGQDIPKQFITIEGKPIITYTLGSFQKHPQVDRILVVCKSGWEETMRAYIKGLNVNKAQWVITGGSKGQEPINNGVQFLKDYSENDDMIITHNGIRPLVNGLVLPGVIIKCKEFGNDVTSLPYNEQTSIKKVEEMVKQYVDCNILQRVSIPQAYQYGKLRAAYDRAVKEDIGMTDSPYTDTMTVDLEEILYFAAGSDKNIKLIITDDLELFKVYLKMKD